MKFITLINNAAQTFYFNILIFFFLVVQKSVNILSVGDDSRATIDV